ncbi:hypothetical protein MUN89_18220 [Halobacillus salinarum]|uniref:Uncharacterized protein n=1 Tax=Halobacillus salinarum TaxID=2932257 RepID=A0ABY4EH48_9BACI|nr:hypothetical protein [Halobacillus salinarum]UOQ43794.1 hypothetical protein MUN89_18220 [Halobacillus salinarum]
MNEPMYYNYMPYWPGSYPAVQQDYRQMPHPILLSAIQRSPNQIELVYDQPVDLQSATNVSNYWIRNNLDRPADIATLGRNDMMLLPTNSLTPNMAMITPMDNSKQRFILAFNVNATPGVQYTVIPCFVNLEGRTGYGGDNLSPRSENIFTAQ